MASKSKRQRELEAAILGFVREWVATNGHVGVIHLGALITDDDDMTLEEAVKELDDIIIDAM